MGSQIAAFAVHAFTALGALLGFQALIDASHERWEMAFAWLGAALVVDGLDGPLARRLNVADKLPRFSGERLDLIVDYLTYVVVPAYIIYKAELAPAGFSSLTAAIILMSSLYHFIDCDSKTGDGFFVGFPAIWNLVAFYLFIFPLPPAAVFGSVMLLALLTFFPSKWIHPVRVRLMRPITFAMMAAWAASALAVLMEGFPGPPAAQAVIAAASVYCLGLGMARSFGPKTEQTATDR